VKRNRTKRILREAYLMNRENFKELNIIFYAEGLLELTEAVSIIKAFREGRCKK
jgi:ribonuclease P protein component